MTSLDRTPAPPFATIVRIAASRGPPSIRLGVRLSKAPTPAADGPLAASGRRTGCSAPFAIGSAISFAPGRRLATAGQQSGRAEAQELTRRSPSAAGLRRPLPIPPPGAQWRLRPTGHVSPAGPRSTSRHPSSAAFFFGAAVAGVGFAGGFQGAIRTVLPLADPAHRAGVLSVIYVVSYVALGVPAICAGFLVVQTGSLEGTARGYGMAVIALAAVAFVGLVRSARTGSRPKASPAQPCPYPCIA